MLRTYTLGVNGFVSAATIEELGLPRHVRQASVLVVAKSKAEAIRVAAGAGLHMISINDREFRMVDGAMSSLLAVEGLLQEPAVYATPTTGSGLEDRLVRIDSSNEVVQIGTIERVGGKPVLTRV